MGSSTFRSPVDSLTSAQAEALEDLRQLCITDSVNWPVSSLEDPKQVGKLDDLTLLRYLRARSYDPVGAFKQYSATAEWRRKQQIDHAYDHVEVENFERTRRLLPTWTGRRDKNGFPIFVHVVSEVRTEDAVKTAKINPDLSSIFLPAEYVTQFIYPILSQLEHGAIDRSTNIIDLTGVGPRKFWTLRSILQAASTMATAHYPETVEKLFVVGAPSFFPTVWGFITKWFDPATTSKITIVPHGRVFSTLSEHIDVEHIPTRFGGKLEWTYGMHPLLDDAARDVVSGLSAGWVEGPLRFVLRDDDEVLLAVGAENGILRREDLEMKVFKKTQVVIGMEKLVLTGDEPQIVSVVA